MAQLLKVREAGAVNVCRAGLSIGIQPQNRAIGAEGCRWRIVNIYGIIKFITNTGMAHYRYCGAPSWCFVAQTLSADDAPTPYVSPPPIAPCTRPWTTATARASCTAT